jgi:hypothetical protein
MSLFRKLRDDGSPVCAPLPKREVRPYVYRGAGYDIYGRPADHARRAGEAGRARAAAETARKAALYAAARQDGASVAEAAAAVGVTEQTARVNYEPRLAAGVPPPGPAAAPPAAPAAPGGRCDACGYLLTSPGHRIACGGAG